MGQSKSGILRNGLQKPLPGCFISHRVKSIDPGLIPIHCLSRWLIRPAPSDPTRSSHGCSDGHSCGVSDPFAAGPVLRGLPGSVLTPVHNLACRLETLRGVFLEAPRDRSFPSWIDIWNLGTDGDTLAVSPLHGGLNQMPVMEREAASGHLVQDNPERIDIRSSSDDPSRHLLRGHVCNRTGDLRILSRNNGGIIGKAAGIDACQTKISNHCPDPAAIDRYQNDISALEIRMHDAGPMRSL